jgi:hypothetical protein
VRGVRVLSVLHCYDLARLNAVSLRHLYAVL